MKKFLFLLAALLLVACGRNSHDKTVREQLDSMKAAASLRDSIKYVHTRDSIEIFQQLVQSKTAALDAAKSMCVRTRDAQYQQQGEWHSRLGNNNDGNRTTLDAFMTDDGAVSLRSTVVGKKSGSKQLVLSSGTQEIMASGGDYFTYDAGGYHELLTYTGRESLDLFDFIEKNSPIEVRQGMVTYTLSESDRKALLQVYTLALAWDAQHRAEFNLRKAQTLLADWDSCHQQH